MRALREFLVCCRCFASAAFFHHQLRTLLFILYLGANYVLQAHWLMLRDFVVNNILFSCTALFYLIEKPVFLMITVPIRNTAIRLARAEYLNQNMQVQESLSDRMNFGSVYAIFKRIEKIFSGLERDLINIIKYLPLLILSAKSTLDQFTNMYAAAMFFAINLASIYYIKFWTRFRKEAYNAEEDLTSQVLKLFQNLDRSKRRMMDFTNKSIAKENSLYVKAILTKQYYKISVCIANIAIIFLAIQYRFYDTNGIISMGFFVFNWTQFSVSLLSMSGMISGLDFKSNLSPKTRNSNNNVLITDLCVDGIFDHVSLEIKDREWAVIGGANGAGKTFLCKLITQQIQNDSVHSPDDYIMITNYSSIFLYEKQNLGKSHIWKTFFAKKYNFLLDAKFVSAGQNAFLCIVSSVTHNPKLLVIDESLDLLEQDMLQDVLVFLRTIDMIFIAISHREEISHYFDRKMVIKNRQIIEI